MWQGAWAWRGRPDETAPKSRDFQTRPPPIHARAMRTRTREVRGNAATRNSCAFANSELRRPLERPPPGASVEVQGIEPCLERPPGSAFADVAAIFQPLPGEHPARKAFADGSDSIQLTHLVRDHPELVEPLKKHGSPPTIACCGGRAGTSGHKGRGPNKVSSVQPETTCGPTVAKI